MNAIKHTSSGRKMRNFRSKDCGRFSCALSAGSMSFDGIRNLLKFQGPNDSDTIVVPDHMMREARQIMRRGNGDKMLDFAYLCLVHECALAEWERVHGHG